MDLLLICRDALENSIIGNLLVALEEKKAGADVGILFTQESLAALAGQAFDWSPLFRDRDTRAKIAKNAKAMGIPLAHAKDSRQTDTYQLLKAAKEAGVALMACPAWSALLGIQERLPEELTKVDPSGALKCIKEAKQVIGTF
jgi:peroxiredoxin family protein